MQIAQAIQPHWSISLGFSEILGIVGLLVGLIGIAIAIQQYRKARSADTAVIGFKRKLHNQKAGQRFSDIAPKAVLLAGQIRTRNWPNCAELATGIGASLANATGFSTALIGEDERNNLELAAGAVEYILENLPIEENNQISAETVLEMTKKCMVIIYAVERIAGFMKSLDETATAPEEGQ